MMRESRTSFRLRRGPGADRRMRSRTVKPFGVSRLEKFVFAFRASEAFSREIKALRSTGPCFGGHSRRRSGATGCRNAGGGRRSGEGQQRRKKRREEGRKERLAAQARPEDRVLDR